MFIVVTVLIIITGELETAFGRSVPAKFLRDFFNYKNVGQIEIYSCSNRDTINLLRGNVNEGLQVTSTNTMVTMSNYKFKIYNRGVYIDTNCKTREESVKLLSSTNSFNTTFSWLFWNDDYNNAIALMGNLQLGMSSDVTLAVPRIFRCNEVDCKSNITMSEENNLSNINTNRNTAEQILLYDLYKILPWTSLLNHLIGRWMLAEGFLMVNKTTRIFNLMKTEMKAGLFCTENIYHPENIVEELQDSRYKPEHDITTRFSYVLSLHLADLYNFSISLVQADSWGIKQANGHFNGIMGLLENKTINMTVSDLQYITSRLEVADFLMPFHPYNFPFVFKQPRALGSYRALSLQLQTTAWIFLAGMLLLCSLIYWTVQMGNLKIVSPFKSSSRKENFSEAVVQVIGIMSQQGIPITPERLSSRLVCACMLLLALLIGLYYNAATMNALLSPAPATIRNIQALISSSIPLVMMDVPFFNNKVTRERLLFKEVNAKVTSKPNFTASIEQGLDIILRGGAFCAEDHTLFAAIQSRFTDKEKCDLTVFSGTPPILAGHYVPKYSSYREIFLRGNLRLREHGLANRELTRWYPKKPSCSGHQIFLFVGLKAVTIAIAIIASGLICSIILIVLELCYANLSRYGRDKNITEDQGFLS